MTKEELDAAMQELAEELTGERRVDLLISIAHELRFTDTDRMRQLTEEAAALAESLPYPGGQARAERQLGSCYELRAEYPQSLEHLEKALELFSQSGLPEEEILTTNNIIAKVYANIGDYTRGLEYLFNNLRLLEINGNKFSEANTVNSMSILYQRIGNAEKAEDCARRCLLLSQETGNQRVLAVSHVNLGNSFGMTKNWEGAIAQWETALAMFEALGEVELQASVLGNLGIACKSLGQYARAEEHLRQCMGIKEKTGNRYDIVKTMQNLAGLFNVQKKYQAALDCCREALGMLKLIDAKSLDYQIWEEHAKASKGLGDFEQALFAFEKYHTLEKEILTEETRAKTDMLQMRFDMDKTEKEKEIYRLRNIDLAEANAKITFQKEEIEEKNRDITASIRYAKRIQEALLPQQAALKLGFRGAFVFYQPRDIVSGDFYWSLLREDAVLFAVADCTGHGVPGALMSVMGGAFLTEIIKERGITNPAEALGRLRMKLITALQSRQETEFSPGSDDSLRDGMDMVLCRYEPATKQLQFAGANNPLWILRQGQIVELKPDKFPVGQHHGELKDFRVQQIQLEEGDQLFLFTDGFADQFGGPRGKKFGYRSLREQIIAVAGLEADQQKEIIARTFYEWKSVHEQTDDVLLAGLFV